MYKCLFNHELLILGTTQSPYQCYRDEISDAQVRGYVRELKDTGVDALMCCPTAWRRNLWRSKVDPHWQIEAPALLEPGFGSDLKYYEKAYYRWRRYMLTGADPVAATLEEAKKLNIAFFISYRMNDHHHMTDALSPTHNRFFLEKRQEHFLPGGRAIDPTGRQGCPAVGYLNYHDPEVRGYYYAILEELAQNYDLDGVELDLMRSPAYFPDGTVAAGIPIMNDFVRSIRALLDRVGEARGKRLFLCVRVPKSAREALEIGLDVFHWDQMGCIDMVNVSSFFINDLALDIAGYQAGCQRAQVYGEMHFIVDQGEKSGFTNNISRKTSREMYWAMADQYLSGGADGVSLFNFDYTRDHHYSEPRRDGDYGCEPPFELLPALSDARAMQTKPKHYYFRAAALDISPDDACARLTLYRNAAEDGHSRAILRVTLREASQRHRISADLDGESLKQIQWMGELFPTLTPEALPKYDQLRFFEVPVHLLTAGKHRLHAEAITLPGGGWRAIELALYNEHSFQ